MLKRKFILAFRSSFHFSKKKLQEEAETANFIKKIEKNDPFFTSSSLFLINKYKFIGLLLALSGGWVLIQGARMVEFGEEEVLKLKERRIEEREEEEIITEKRKKIRMVKFKNGK